MADDEFEEFRQAFDPISTHAQMPSACYMLAHDIALREKSTEDVPNPPRTNLSSSSHGLEIPSKCCSSDAPCCPELPPNPKISQILSQSPHHSSTLHSSSVENPLCGSPGPRKCSGEGVHNSQSVICSSQTPVPKKTSESVDPLSIESLDFNELERAALDPECDDDFICEETAGGEAEIRVHKLLHKQKSERKRRKLPQIPQNQKSFSAASILALRTPTLAEELQDAESGVGSRSSSPEGYSLLSSHSRPILVLKCHSYIRDDTSPELDLRIPHHDIDSGHSTQHSPDGAKSFSPVGVNEISPVCSIGMSEVEILDATHRGLYRFIPRHSDEIELQIGDPIYVQKEADDLWCEGVNLKTGKQGIFPAAYVTDVDYSEFDPTAKKIKKERYLLNYLGSIETLCHKGNEVLCQAVRKIARGQSLSAYPHSCMLEISDQGILMVDKSKQQENKTGNHDYFYHLKHVSFCGFHPKDPRYFGFITKHPAVQRFACHVFSANESTRPVAEAVGRAFQRFYIKYIEEAYPTEDIYLE